MVLMFSIHHLLSFDQDNSYNISECTVFIFFVNHACVLLARTFRLFTNNWLLLKRSEIIVYWYITNTHFIVCHTGVFHTVCFFHIDWNHAWVTDQHSNSYHYESDKYSDKKTGYHLQDLFYVFLFVNFLKKE